MSKTKQWAWDEAEKAVDKIILQVKQNLITKQTAKKDIMNVENVEYVLLMNTMLMKLLNLN